MLSECQNELTSLEYRGLHNLLDQGVTRHRNSSQKYSQCGAHGSTVHIYRKET